MKKIHVLWIILDLIFLVIFNAFFFALGIVNNTSVWISFGFIHFAYFMLLLTPILIRKGKSTAVFGFSLYAIATVYFIIELAAGITFILVSLDNFTVTLLVQLCITGLYCIILVSSMIANEHTANAEEKRQYNITYIKDASVKLKGLLERVADKEAKKMVERVYDAVYSSPVKSHPDLAKMEKNIIQSINNLEDEITAGNKDRIIIFAKSLLESINERNVKLIALN